MLIQLCSHAFPDCCFDTTSGSGGFAVVLAGVAASRPWSGDFDSREIC